jgi:AraC-like DNA-binding protein
MKTTAFQLIQPILNELQARNGALTEGEAAQLMNRSKRRLRYQFTRGTGMNFRTAQLKAKMERGESLLIRTCLTIAEISAQLGYSDRTKFERAFKRFYRMTPTQYRLR